MHEDSGVEKLPKKVGDVAFALCISKSKQKSI
jgi:hypothetical protein